MFCTTSRTTVPRRRDGTRNRAGGLGFEVRELPDEESGGGGALVGCDCRTWNRGASGGRGSHVAEHFTERVQALSLCSEAGDEYGAVRFSGRRGSRGHSESSARVE